MQKSSFSTLSAAESGEGDDVSMDEVGTSQERSQDKTPSEGSIEPEPSTAGSIADAGVAQTNANDTIAEIGAEGAAIAPIVPASDSSETQQSIEPTVTDDTHDQVNVAMASTSTPDSVKSAGTEIVFPTMPEQVDTARADETAPMELDSRSPSPEAAVLVSNILADVETNESRQPSASVPEQISSVAQPREEVQEIETETTGEVNVVSSRGLNTFQLTKSQMHNETALRSASSLVPYESPLRFFHAYRFHPDYRSAVPGGLKSLTYSNRINTQKELCPYELTGEQCPANCEFQHFGAISPPGESFQTLNGC